MTIDDKITQILHARPNINMWLDMYRETGHKTYELLFLEELKIIKPLYHKQVTKKFEFAYEQVKELYQ